MVKNVFLSAIPGPFSSRRAPEGRGTTVVQLFALHSPAISNAIAANRSLALGSLPGLLVRMRPGAVSGCLLNQ